MKNKNPNLYKNSTAGVFLVICLLILSSSSCNSEKPLNRPQLAKQQELTETYYGVEVRDPYRYMENLNDTAVLNWMKVNSNYTRSVLNKIPGRERIVSKLLEFNQRKSSTISSIQISANGRYFYLKSNPEDNIAKLYMRDHFNAEEKLLFNPEDYNNEEGKIYSILSVSPSPDGSKVAFDISANGSESSTLLIIESETGQLFPEQLSPCWMPSPSWLPDNKSFVYIKMLTPDLKDMDLGLVMETFIHKTGTYQKDDRLIFSRDSFPEVNADEIDYPYTVYDKSGNNLVMTLFNTDSRMKIYYLPLNDLEKSNIRWTKVCSMEDEIVDFPQFLNNKIYLKTTKESPSGKIISINQNAEVLLDQAITIIEGHNQDIISSFLVKTDGIYYFRTINGIEQKLFFRSWEGREEEIRLPFSAGSAYLSDSDYTNDYFWINISGWTKSDTRYRYSIGSKSFSEENLNERINYPEFEELIVEELNISSYDGVMVPLSLIYKKGLKKNGKNPVLMYGYGAYGAARSPNFSQENLLWTWEGGIYAVAHVRGGGELGDKWHKGGFKSSKPNTWKDFIACAEYLIENKYTAKGKIAITGSSAGGILIGRAMTERPDLFAAAIPRVGIMNAVRNETYPNGLANVPEFGSVKDSLECMALIEMDAYLNIKPGTDYPGTLVTAGFNDPRVIVWQPAKYAARLQSANTSDKPVLFHVDYDSGHSLNSSKSSKIEGTADILSFALWQVGHPRYKAKINSN